MNILHEQHEAVFEHCLIATFRMLDVHAQTLFMHDTVHRNLQALGCNILSFTQILHKLYWDKTNKLVFNI